MLYTDDVDATFKRATAAGATADMAPSDMPWGDRMGNLTIRSATAGPSPRTRKTFRRRKSRSECRLGAAGVSRSLRPRP